MSHKGQAKIKDQKYSQIYVNKMTQKNKAEGSNLNNKQLEI